jgi:hypothetical protein
MCALASCSITLRGDANAVVRFVHRLGTNPICRPTPAAPSSDHLAINEIRALARVGLHVLAQPSGTARGSQRWEAMGDLLSAFLVPSPGCHGRARMYELACASSADYCDVLFTLLRKSLPAAHQNWLHVAHIRYAAGTTLLVFDYPLCMAWCATGNLFTHSTPAYALG